MVRFFYSVFRAPLNFLFTLWARGASAVCLVECDGQFLFIRTGNYPLLWALPGGRVKKGEPPASAVAREVREEVGISIHDPKLFGEQTSKKGDTVISRTHCFYSNIEKQELRLDEREILEARWFGWENIPQPLSLTTERAIALFNRSTPTL